jgi:hypothetical protein
MVECKESMWEAPAPPTCSLPKSCQPTLLATHSDIGRTRNLPLAWLHPHLCEQEALMHCRHSGAGLQSSGPTNISRWSGKIPGGPQQLVDRKAATASGCGRNAAGRLERNAEWPPHLRRLRTAHLAAAAGPRAQCLRQVAAHSIAQKSSDSEAATHYLAGRMQHGQSEHERSPCRRV